MEKPKVMLDIDGVMADFCLSFMKYLNKAYKCDIDETKDPKEYSFDEWGCEQDVNFTEAAMEWMISDGFRTLNLFSGAKDFFKELSEVADIYIVTARTGDWKGSLGPKLISKIKKDTLFWLESNNLRCDRVFFTSKKVDFCIKNGINVMIEDKLSTALEGSIKGISTILINKRYNYEEKDSKLIHRVYNFNEVIKNFVKINDQT